MTATTPHPAKKGVSRAMLTLDNGEIIVDRPTDLSLEDVEEMETFFEVLLKQAKRNASRQRSLE
jgi:hypothetical protein